MRGFASLRKIAQLTLARLRNNRNHRQNEKVRDLSQSAFQLQLFNSTLPTELKSHIVSAGAQAKENKMPIATTDMEVSAAASAFFRSVTGTSSIDLAKLHRVGSRALTCGQSDLATKCSAKLD